MGDNSQTAKIHCQLLEIFLTKTMETISFLKQGFLLRGNQNIFQRMIILLSIPSRDDKKNGKDILKTFRITAWTNSNQTWYREFFHK